MSGLLEAVDKITVTVSNFRATDTTFFEEYKKLSPKIHIEILKNIEFRDECDTLNYLREYVKNFEQNKPILYLHTKGVSQIHPIIKKNIEGWNRVLDYWCIWDWEKCVKALETHDTAGGLFVENNCPGHYSGNYYWFNSHYITTLPVITPELHKTINRGEFWLSLNKNLKAFNGNTIELLNNHNLYENYFDPENFYPKGWQLEIFQKISKKLHYIKFSFIEFAQVSPI